MQLRIRLFSVLLFVFTSLLPNAQEAAKEPYRKDQIEQALAYLGPSDSPDSLIMQIVSRGVDFQLTLEEQAEWRKTRKVSTRFLEALGNSYRPLPRHSVPVASPNSVPIEPGLPLSKEEIVTLLRDGSSQSRIEQILRVRGLRLANRDSDIEEIGAAGAPQLLIDLIRSLAPPVDLPTPAPHPPAPRELPTPAPHPPAISLADAQTLRSVHKIFIDKLPNDLDQYVRAELSKQLKGKVTVVLEEKGADGILTGVSEEEKGTGAKITGRYLGLHDLATASLSLLDKERKTILWADEAGDRSLFFSVAHRGGERKVAERLVKKLKKAMQY